MPIWDDLKPYWQLAGVALAKRSKVNVIDRQVGVPSQARMTDGPNRVDLTLPETSPLYIFSTVAAPFSATGDDLWLAPFGQLFSINQLFTPIAVRQTLSVITWRCLTSLADQVQIDVCKNGGSPTGITLTTPAGGSSPLVSVEFPVVFDIGDDLALRVRQLGTTAGPAWNAYICVG